eukprot:3898300-Pyramimonas_sp.AAC.1
MKHLGTWAPGHLGNRPNLARAHEHPGTRACRRNRRPTSPNHMNQSARTPASSDWGTMLRTAL